MAGARLGRTHVTFHVTPPAATTCVDTLRALGVEFTDGPTAEGVATPVTIHLPLNGIAYHPSSLANAPRTTWFMDCELATAMWKMGEVFHARGITDAWDYGIYNYRCIDQTVDPPCPGSSLSQHAYAQAVDVAGVKLADGTTYSVNDDWVIDVPPSGHNACTVTPAATPKNEALHALACELNGDHVYDVILTPNYNAAHRNHMHMDLTSGAWLLHKTDDRGIDVGSEDD